MDNLEHRTGFIPAPNNAVEFNKWITCERAKYERKRRRWWWRLWWWL